MRYLFSDLHFNHWHPETQRGIISFERMQFKTIKEHDDVLIEMITNLTKKLTDKDEVWNLGDFGSTNYLWTIDLLNDTGAKTYFVLGNHDKAEDVPLFEKHFYEVYQYPIYLSQKLVVSHFPVAVYQDQCNVHGHLHGSRLADVNHLNASVHVANYKPITDKNIATVFSQLPKFNRHFLYEPWAEDYVFLQEKEDAVYDRSGKIDLSASRVFQKINTAARKQEENNYQPYCGGFNCNCSKSKQEGK